MAYVEQGNNEENAINQANPHRYHVAPAVHWQPDYNHAKEDEENSLEYHLFAQAIKDHVGQYTIIFLDDIRIDCKIIGGINLDCLIKAKDLVQERKHIYIPKVIDSNGSVKRNYFVNPVEITLEYIDE